ncbi:MAG TPA: efflux RND transporter permease subunit, partial [Longimicrobiales bacterium]|nr:efflux RND transporter permease subunit [Longimicrobiales bacterium]
MTDRENGTMGGEDGAGPPLDANGRAHGNGTGSEPAIDRRFRLTDLALAHRTSVLVVVAIITILGLTSYLAVPKEASPEVTVPVIAVSTIYAGASPRDVETLVTRKIEEELNTIPEITVLTSTSVEGVSSVVAEFDVSMDMEAALRKVREKVDLAKPELPADAEEPTVLEFNLSDWPIMQVNISGEYGLVRLKEVAEDLQERLEQIPALLEVRLAGGLEREVMVDVDLSRLQYYGLSFDDVIDAIREENLNIPGGSIDVGTVRYPVRVAGEFVDPSIVEDIVVATVNNRPVYVRDVATVDFGFPERTSYARLDGQPVVTLDIIKRSGENIIETAEAVKAVIAEMAPSFPPSTVVKITGDQSVEIHDMVSTLENSIISGLILVAAVLLFFLGLRNATFVAISIPLSMLLSFIVMSMMGFTMNMVVLFSLILALGMLVDNAIVVVENIYRHLDLIVTARQAAGEPVPDAGLARLRMTIEAASRATGEVAMPVIASTATTVGAFAPLLFWPGIVGEFMGYLPMTLIITLTSSLFVALVIVPVLCALYMRLDHMPPPAPPTRAARLAGFGVAGLVLLMTAAANVLTAVLLAVTAVGLVALHRAVLVRLARAFQDRFVPAIIAWYERRLRWALDHRLIVVGGTVVAFIVTVIAFVPLNAGVEFFPENIPPTTVYVTLDVPSGTRTEFLNQVTQRIEEQIAAIPGIEDLESLVATVGRSSGGAADFMGLSGDATLVLTFRKYEDLTGDVFATIRRMQEELGIGIAGVEVTVEEQAMGPPTGAPVNIEIVGDDPDVLKRLSDQAMQVLRSSPVFSKLVGLESDVADTRPELVIDVDRERAALYGLSTAKIGGTVRSAILGTEAAKFRTGNDEYDIRVRLAAPYREDLNALQDLTVVSDMGQQVPLVSVASWRIAEAFGSIHRKDMDRVVTISSDVRAGENSNAVLAEVQATLQDFASTLPAGYSIRYTGQQEEQMEAQEFLGRAFLIAIMVIALILVSQFNSIVKPMIVLTSVIMSTIGVLLGLMVFRMPFGIIMTGVGVISLAGVVVNNAIVLIDYIDLLRERDGLSRREALVQAGKTRFRPVVLTAATTLLGLVPLAIGLNFDFLGLYTSLAPDIYWGGVQAAWWGPMAIAVIAGLGFATVLTLV